MPLTEKGTHTYTHTHKKKNFSNITIVTLVFVAFVMQTILSPKDFNKVASPLILNHDGERLTFSLPDAKSLESESKFFYICQATVSSVN